MKSISSVFAFCSLILFGASALALDFSIVGACDSKAFFQKTVSVSGGTLGDLTVEILNSAQVPFQGDRSGIKSIQNSPVGDEALEVLSDSQMRSYGWCVLVDGKMVERMPDEVVLTSDTRSVQWFYAFAFYDRGQWTQFCVPSFSVKPSQVCPY